MTDTAALIMLVGNLVKKVDELSNENYQQKEQIKKMRCCQNCDNYDCTEPCEHKDCKYQYSKCIETDETGDYWELAE